MQKITLLLLSLFLTIPIFSQVLPDNWTGDTDIDTYQESTNIHGGTYACRVDVNSGSQANCDMRHDEVTVNAGDTYTLKLWVWTSDHVKARMVLEWTGATATYTTYSNAATGGFEEVTASGTVPTGASGVKVGVRFYDQSGFSAPETQYLDDISFESPTGNSISLTNGNMELWPAGNQSPIIINIANTPTLPSSSETVSISADITDSDGSLSSAECHWGTTSGSLGNTINMSLVSADTYGTLTNIPSQSNATTVYYEIYALDNDGGSTTSAEQSYTVSDEFGKLIITEVMQNPNDVGDADGEWFEIFNTTASDIDIDGWLISDAGSDSHTISNGGALTISAGGFLVLGSNSTTSTNGGVPVDYQYSGISLTNSADELIIKTGAGAEVARIEWDGGTNWPDPTGASMVFTGLSSDNNNDGQNWTTSFLRENNYTNPVGVETDFGSPGINGMYQNLISSTTWTGSGNWSEGNAVGSSNWSNGSPGASVNVTIDGTLTVDMQSANIAECNDLSVSASGSLSVSSGKALTINGNFTNSGTVTINSDATGNGSMIVEGTAAGNIDIERYFEAYTGAGDGWHFISSPVNAMTIAGSDFEPGASDDLYAWDEDDYLWRNYKGANFPGTTFQNGYGYMVAYVATVTNTFTGSLNNADIAFSNLTKTASKGDGWHLIGNPFSSAIYWGTGDWNLSNVGAVAKVYDEAAGNYIDKSASDIIPSTNGFFIQVSSATNSLTIPLAARVHDATNNYKNTESEVDLEKLKLIINNDENSFYDVTNIAFKAEANTAFDWDYDAHKMFGQSVAPQLWTSIENEDFSTNILPHVYESLSLDLNFKAGSNTSYHIIAEGIESFYSNSEIYLEDIVAEEIIDLRETTFYTFQATTSDNIHRFKLHFYGVTSIDDNTSDETHVYSQHNKVVVNLPAIGDKYSISIYDIMGRLIIEEDAVYSGNDIYNIDGNNKIIIVRISQNNKTESTKILLK